MKKVKRTKLLPIGIEWESTQIVVSVGKEKHTLKLKEFTGRQIMHILVDMIADKKEEKL